MQTEKSNENRDKVIELFNKGFSYSEVSKQTAITRSTVAGIIKRARDHGTVRVRPGA
jgi:transposase